MDNLTHTLIGALIGETAARSTKPTPGGLTSDLRRTLLVGAAAVGSNLPDCDLLYSFFGTNVNYLLHHRGHTHTIAGALVLAVLVYVLVQWWLRRRPIAFSNADRAWIGGTLVVTALLHVGMDYMNNYGVHPFWPIDTRWRYGDSVFIIEPLLWAACAPLALLFKARWARALVMLLLGTGLALVFFTGMVPASVATIFVALICMMLLVARFTRPRVALGASVALWLGITVMFAAAAEVAAGRLEQQAHRDFPRSRLLDHVVSPMPANPLCWEVILIQSENDQLALRRAMLALAPGWLPADQCGRRSLELRTTAPLAAVQASDRAAMKWHGEILTPQAAIASLARSDCTAAAALRFMRAPYLTRFEDKRILGDLRYDREAGLGFAEIELGLGDCPLFVPSWIPPREDILHP